MILKRVLLVNGISSGATGLLLASTPQTFAHVFGVEITSPFTATGVILILFSIMVLTSAFRRPINPKVVKSITILDVLWVVGSALCIGVFYATISGWGSFIIVAVGFWVGLMA